MRCRRRDSPRSGDLSIAYQVIGEGDVDVILVPQWLSNIEQYWDSTAASYFLRRIASFSRLIMFDKRGTGLSDPVPSTQTLEERMDDVLAVMDAVGSERAVLFGPSEGGPMAALFAATYPERCISLILYGACARWLSRRDYPEGRPAELVQAGGQLWIDGWGSGTSPACSRRRLARDANFRQWWGQFERHSVRPGMVAADLRDDQRARHPRGAPRDPGPDARPAPARRPARRRRQRALPRRATSRARATSSWTATTTSTSPAMPTRCSTRSRSSSPARAESTTPTASSRR